MKNKLFIFESTEWTRVRSTAIEPEEIFDPAFIAMMPSNIQSYYATYGQTTLKLRQVSPPRLADLVNACAFGSASTTACVSPTPFPLVNGTTAVPGNRLRSSMPSMSAYRSMRAAVLPENQYTLVGRVDFNPTDKTQMYFRGGREYENQFLGSTSYSAYPQYDVGALFLNQSYLYSVSHTYSPNLFLGVKASYTRYNSNHLF